MVYDKTLALGNVLHLVLMTIIRTSSIALLLGRSSAATSESMNSRSTPERGWAAARLLDKATILFCIQYKVTHTQSLSHSIPLQLPPDRRCAAGNLPAIQSASSSDLRTALVWHTSLLKEPYFGTGTIVGLYNDYKGLQNR